MREQLVKNLQDITEEVPIELKIAYENTLKIKAFKSYQKCLFVYKGKKVALTEKQIKVLRLVSCGFSNSRIAKTLNIKEPTVKILIYRLIKYLEIALDENIDRFYVIIIAQEMFSC